MVNVCHIISGDLWAGAEVMDYHLIRKLNTYQNLKLSAILLNEGKLANEIRALGVPVEVVEERQGSFVQLVRNIGRILDRISPNIIHAHRYKENIIAFLSSRRQNDVRLVTTQHGMPEPLGTNRNMKYRILHKLNILLLSSSFRKVIAVSKDIQDLFLDKYRFAQTKISVIHNGTDILRNFPERKGRDSFTIGSMGRIYPVKDYPLMVEIAREVNRKTDKIRFELAGDGPEMNKIKELVEGYRLGKTFTLRGTVEDLDEFYPGIDLYLNTSHHEGIPMSILEAMSYGIPVVAPDIGGLKEVVNDGVEGYLVDGRDPKAFSARCLHLYNDRRLRESMSASAREKIKREFSNDRMACEYHDLYLEVAQSP